MLKFYYNPMSVNARRVWIALLEKQIPFTLGLIKLDGDQFQDNFTRLNPLQRIPVLVDNGLRIVESLAILDYLEAKYPSPSLMPTIPDEIATVRMVEMVAVNELRPATIPLTQLMLGLEVAPYKLESARKRVNAVMQFYENLLANQAYFADNKLTLADIVAGTLIPSLPVLGFSLDTYPHLKQWLEMLKLRESWQQTTPNPDVIEASLPTIRAILARR